MFSRRLRWLVVATGLVAAIALFPIVFLLYPAILVAGGALQPRFPKTGRWFAWIGIAELWVVFITYGLRVFFPHPLLQPRYMILAFSFTVPLLIWCSAELVADVLKQRRDLRSVRATVSEPMRTSVWIATGISLYAAWDAYTLLAWYFQSRDHMADAELCAFWMRLVLIVIVIAFDISLVRRALEMKRYGNLDGPRAS